MQLKKIHPNGIHVFQIVDVDGYDIVLRRNGLTVDYGKRIIKNGLSEVMPENKTESVFMIVVTVRSNWSGRRNSEVIFIKKVLR